MQLGSGTLRAFPAHFAHRLALGFEMTTLHSWQVWSGFLAFP